MTVILPRLPAILHVTSVTQTHSCKLLSRVVATGLVSCQRCFYSSNHRDNSLDYDHGGLQQAKSGYRLPQRRRNKVVTAEDAVSLVKSGDTVCVSGFVCQGAPEHLLKALGDYYDEHGTPHSLTLLFGGGPGDYGERGLNHLAKEKAGCEPMLIRTIGGHYGQVPKVAALALAEKIEAHVLPMGSISRMIRAQASHSPGHITTVGLNTFLDPETGNGGAVNETALKSQLHKELITRIKIHGQDYLMYKALPIDVAIIRATTADSMGNLTVEDESLLCDQMITAAAARNSGGIVIAQVKRLAAVGSLPTRQVAVPGPLVDCVVVVDEDLHARDHAMSYLTVHDPFLTNQIRSPSDFLEKMELNERKVIARRAAMMLEPGKFVNLGIGLPDGVASVAAEEGLLKFITLTTEPGVVGGLPASGHEFGPAANADALIEMNQMFDFYNGGILDICMLGATEISPQGDVNVSRIGMNKLTGPGGFVDITQSTRIVVFMGTFKAKGLKVGLKGDGSMTIDHEGAVNKYVNKVYEKTFSGDEAVRRGQQVYYISERCVFRRTAAHDTIELIEIAPGINVQTDILDQMDFEPAISPNLKTMDKRLFKSECMDIKAEAFGSLEDRCTYNADDHVLYVDLFGVSHGSETDVRSFFHELEMIYSRCSDAGKNPINVYVNYDGFDCSDGLENLYGSIASELERKYFKSVKRVGGKAFRRAKLGQSIRIAKWDPDDVFDDLDKDKNGFLSAQDVREGLYQMFLMKLTESELKRFFGGDLTVSRSVFVKAIPSLFKQKGLHVPDDAHT